MREKPKIKKQNQNQLPEIDDKSLIQKSQEEKSYLSFNEDEDQDEVEDEDEKINAIFDPEQIRIDSRIMTIDLLLTRIKYAELDLAPDFQRHAGIWKDDAKSRLIESIIIRIPLPSFYMDATNEDQWLVIDGLQRLTSLKKFVIDKELRLKGLEYLKEYENKTYDELPRSFQRRINETQVIVYVVEKGTPEEVKFNIFGRINTGGLPLSPQELRHAMNPGQAPKILKNLAELEEFEKVTRIKAWRKERMEDREFILRFLAFKMTSYRDYKEGSLKVFLDQAMKKLNQLTEKEVSELEFDFRRVMKAAFEIFGDQAFRRRIYTENTGKRSEPNRALFEAWTVNLNYISDQDLQLLKQRKQLLIDKFNDLVNRDNKFIAAISQGMGAVDKVRYRISTIEKLIQEVLRK
ncbi:MAG TPA: DUF262 domain-containing protein [Candidatus Obscuribacterales bacterium]